MKGVNMKRRNTVRVKRILLIISAFMLMVLLCGCRTRVTNNTEVTNVLEDGGMLQESYQIRRDELGIPVAETPLFTGWESDSEEYDEYEDYYDDFGDFDEEDDEDYEDEEELTERRNTDTDTNTDPARRQQYQPARRTSETKTEDIKVTLDVNAKDAHCIAAFVMIKKGATYGALPEPSRSGYNFKGWYTAKKDGDKVTSKSKLKSDKAHTLYAHWKKAEKKTYTITFDGNGEEDEVTLSSTEMTVEEGGKYGDMPSAKRKKHTFSGWFTEAEGGSQITGGSKFTGTENQTLYAHWEYDPYTWWDGEFNTASNEIDEEVKVGCIIDGSDDTEEDFLKECRGSLASDEKSPGFIIKFVKNYDEETAATEAEALYAKYKDTAPGAKVIIISDKALKGSKEQKLLYKMMLFNALYGADEESDDTEAITEARNNIDEATADLLDEENTVFYPFIYSGSDYEVPPDETIDGSDIEVIDDSSDQTADDSSVETIEPSGETSEVSGETSEVSGETSDVSGGANNGSDIETVDESGSEPSGETSGE